MGHHGDKDPRSGGNQVSKFVMLAGSQSGARVSNEIPVFGIQGKQSSPFPHFPVTEGQGY